MPSLVSCEMKSEKRTQKFHIDDASLPKTGKYLWLAVPNGKFAPTNQKHYPDLGSTAVIGMFLRRHFTGKPVEALWNVSYFLSADIPSGKTSSVARSKERWLFSQVTMMPIWLMLQVLAHFTWPGAEITSCGTVGVLEVHTDIKWMPLDTTVTPPLHRCSKQGVHYN